MKLDPESLARGSSRHPWRTLAVWLLVIVAMGAVSGKYLDGVLNQEFSLTNRPESVRADELISQKFSASNAAEHTEMLIVGSDAVAATDPAFRREVDGIKTAVQQELGKTAEDVLAGPVITYADAEAQAESLFTQDGNGALIPLQLLATDGNGSSATVAALEKALPSAAPSDFQAQVLSPEQLAQMQGSSQDGGAPADPPEAVVVVTSQTTTVSDPAFSDAVKAVQGAVVQVAGNALAAEPVSGYDAREMARVLVASDGKTSLVPVSFSTREGGDAHVEKLRAVASRASTGGFTVQVAGQETLRADMSKIAEEDLRRGEGVGLVVALIVLILVFAAVVAAIVPIVMGMFAIAVALGLVAIIGQFAHFNLFVENMVSMLGLALGIDYSLFIVSRYREERRKGFDKLEAIGAAGATASRAVFFSGVTVVFALVGMLIIPTSMFRSLAGGAILVTLAAIAASMTLLPVILGLLGDRINWPRLSRRSRVDVEPDPKGGFWDRLTRGVMARPVAFLLASVLVLGGLGAFYFQLDRGTSMSATKLPDATESKQAFLTLENVFKAGGAAEPAKIVVTGEVKSQAVGSAVATLREEIAGDPAFSPTTSVAPSSDGSALLVSAYLRGDPTTEPAFDAIRDLRATLVPAAFDGVSNATVLVGGDTAFFVDYLKVADRYQWIVIPFVLALSLLLLTVVFRSIVVPIKAIIMNLLSVGAAYGAITLVFQKGVGIGFFNDLGVKFQKVDAIESWLPLLMFSVLFGLSMDYHVFLLTRIREEYDKTGDNAEAVAHGLRTTAGLITGAAVIMVAVFLSFASGRIGALQQMGFGLAVAVFMDATIVRTLLVPASMRLLGDLNWYLPKWLEWLPKINVEGHEPEQQVLRARVEPVPVDGAELEVVSASGQ